ncbi:helix-turn-helix domain-containing protein [Thermomicrobiaceae bacterium CFH 74404]|uniref:Helix-turn-helix domain-containing protein n=1 Tax=Thermalbibacter longus TaxID=2951981 RepID=A0AA42B9U9_9BACT|nr:helix-turn-helix domain-containing protein [Thermalbibacter longus]MCM8747705.1 helix-turn-helix domain-containing protein [Thermalbibacter longus]
MSEITLRDLCRWDRRFTLVVPSGMQEETILDRAISWAVSVRVGAPHLPPLRGDELIVLSGRVLHEIESTASLTRDELLVTLSQAPVTALVTEPGLFSGPVGSLPLLLMPGPLPLDLELTLNRLLTEQRSALYRLTTELSRDLSRAAVGGGGLEAVLQVAALASGRSLALQDAEGQVLAQAGPEPAPVSPGVLGRARPYPAAALLPSRGGGELLLTTMTAGGRPAYLALSSAAGGLTERDRLVLSITAGVCTSLLARDPRRAGRVNITGELVADLLLGRASSEAAVHTRAQRLGLDPQAPVVVGLVAAPENPQRGIDVVRRATGRLARERWVELGDEVAFLVPAIELQGVIEAFRSLARSADSAGWSVALSACLSRLREAPEGLRQARFALALWRSGAVPGPLLRFEAVEDLGLFSLLYYLWGNRAGEAFRRAVLGPLADRSNRTADLIETLQAYLTWGSAGEVAARLGLHRNTVGYRLNRISQLTGRDLNNPQHRLLLHVAVLLGLLPPPEPQPVDREAD